MTDKTLHELPPACLKLIPDTALPTKPLPIPAAASLPLFTSSPWWLHGPPPLLTTPHLHHAPFALLGCLIPKGSKLTSSRQSSLISPSPLLPQHLYQSEGTASLLLSRPPPRVGNSLTVISVSPSPSTTLVTSQTSKDAWRVCQEPDFKLKIK